MIQLELFPGLDSPSTEHRQSSNHLVLDRYDIDALKRIVAYLSGEKKHYEERGRPPGHIWPDVDWLATQLRGRDIA